MGKLDIVQWTDQSIPSAHDNPKIYSCFGLYPRLFTGNKFIYKGAMVSDDFEKPEMCVIKTRRFKPGTERFWQGEIDLNRYANEMAIAFTDQTLAAKIDLVDQYIAPLRGHTRWDKVCFKMKPNYFRKLLKFEIVLIENAVRNVQMLNKDKVLEAFSHFTYSESNEQSVLHSFRGCTIDDGKYLLLTPDMFTHKFDIHRWFQKHTCNNICGKFKRPLEASQPDKPLDVDTDAMYYNFDNDRKPVNEKENFSKETQEESGEKHVNFETTFGAKSCDGTYSVVTALIHSGIEGKCEPMTSTQMDYTLFSGELDTQNNNVNLNEYQADQFKEERSEHACVSFDCLDGGDQTYDPDKALGIEQCDLNKPDIEDKYLQTALLARDENTLETPSCEIEYDEPNAHTEASTLIIRSANPYRIPNTDNERENLPFSVENNVFTEERLCRPNYTTGSEFDILDTNISFDTPDRDKEMCLEERLDNCNEPQGPHNTDILPEFSPEVQTKVNIQYQTPVTTDNIEEITSHEQNKECITNNLDETQGYHNTQFKTQDNLECQIISLCDEQQLRSEEFITEFTADTRAEKLLLETSSSSSSSSLDITPNIPTTQVNGECLPDQVLQDSVFSHNIDYQYQSEQNDLYIEENNSDLNENSPQEIQNVICTGLGFPTSDSEDGKMINVPVTHETYNYIQVENEANAKVITGHTLEYSENLERTVLDGQESTTQNVICTGPWLQTSDTADGKVINVPVTRETSNYIQVENEAIAGHTLEYSENLEKTVLDGQESMFPHEVEYPQSNNQGSLHIKENISDLKENSPQEISNVICMDYRMPTGNTTGDKTIEVPETHEKYNYAQTESEAKVQVIEHALVHSENSESNAPKMYCEYSDIVKLNTERDQQPQEHNESDKNNKSEMVREHFPENVPNASERNEHHDILRNGFYDDDNSESKMWSHPDFLVKYNLQNFVDSNEKSSDHIIQSTCIPHNIEEQRKEIMVNLSSPNPASISNDIIEPERIQKPLHSSLRSRKQRQTTKSVKFADDVKNDSYIERQQTERVLLHKPTNVMSVISKTSQLQINPAVLEQCKTNVNLKDPNWYTYIPCECCDNENITGRD